MISRHCLSLIVALGALSFCSCRDSEELALPDQKAPDGQDVTESSSNSLPQVDTDDASVDDLLADSIISGTKVFEGLYSLKAKAFGRDICEGEVRIKLNLAFSKDGKLIEIPKGNLTCPLGIELDLVQLLGPLVLQPEPSQVNAPNTMPSITVSDGAIHIGTIGAATFNPPRPILPSFLAETKERLRALKVSRSLTVRNSQSGESGSGTISINMLGWDETYKPSGGGADLGGVMRFETVMNGFDSVSNVQNFLPDRLEVGISLESMAITQIKIEGEAVAIMKEVWKDDGFQIPLDLISAMTMLAKGLIKTIDIAVEVELLELK